MLCVCVCVVFLSFFTEKDFAALRSICADILKGLQGVRGDGTLIAFSDVSDPYKKKLINCFSSLYSIVPVRPPSTHTHIYTLHVTLHGSARFLSI